MYQEVHALPALLQKWKQDREISKSQSRGCASLKSANFTICLLQARSSTQGTEERKLLCVAVKLLGCIDTKYDLLFLDSEACLFGYCLSYIEHQSHSRKPVLGL